MRSQNNIFVFVVVALLIVAGQASAQPLADRVPADALGSVLGQVTPDDVLGRVFASFCIGK